MAGRSDEQRGLVYGIAAYVLWGVFPLYFPLLEPAGTAEILAERMVWSLFTMLAVVTVTRKFGSVRAVLRDGRRFRLLACGAVLVAVNWGTYIYGVNTDRVVETRSARSRCSSSASTTGSRRGSR